MSLVERFHGGRNQNHRVVPAGDQTGAHRTQGHRKPDRPTQGSIPPVIVRHYDLLWQVLSMGQARDAHSATLMLVGFERDHNMLDIGCGSGTLIVVAAERFEATGHLVGLDVEPKMIAQAQAKADGNGIPTTFAKGAITAVPYPDESFDIAPPTTRFSEMYAPR